ncbi:MAG: hypothetical protein ACRC35_12260 [Angustibacter sp.]
MRKTLTGVMATIALSTVMLMGGQSAATAAPVNATATHTTQQAAQSAGTQARSGYVYFTWYWTESNCENNGARLQVRGVISNYYCVQSPFLTYYLYVLYR